MILYIEEYEGFTLDEFTDSIISQKILNINENELLSRLAGAIKHKFASLYTSAPSNIFTRATLADSTYKSQPSVVFSTDAGRNAAPAFRPKPRMPQRPTILNWFKRDASKSETTERKPAKQECVEPEEQPPPSIVPIDIDPFGTLVISGDMLSFSSDSDPDLEEEELSDPDNPEDSEAENTDLKCLTTSSIANNEFPVEEDAETCMETNSLNNLSTDCSQSSKCLDFDIAEQTTDPAHQELQADATSYSNQIELAQDANEELNSENTQESPTSLSNEQWAEASSAEPKPEEGPESAGSKGREKADPGYTHHLGNNIIVLYGGANNVIGCYWLLSKVFDCDMRSLVVTTEQEYEFIGPQNRRIQHVDCKTLQTYLSSELVPLEKLKETLLSRHSQVSVLEHFEHLDKGNQMLLSKWFSRVYEKVFILLCTRTHWLDFRIKSHSLMFRISGLDRDRFVEYTHKQFLRLYHTAGVASAASTSGAPAPKDAKLNYCLSRLNIIEIANRVDFDVVLFYNTLIDSQRNYFNALRKHKPRVSHRLLRNVTHAVLNSHSARSGSLSRPSAPSAARDGYYYYVSSGKDLERIIADIIADYGLADLDTMLFDFYVRLFELANPDLHALKPQVNHLISDAFVNNDILDALPGGASDPASPAESQQADSEGPDELGLRTRSMKLLVDRITALVNDFRSNST